MLDVGTIFNVEATHLLAFGPGLVGHQLHAQNIGRTGLHVINRLGHFHATAFAAATRVDLRLDDPNRATQFLRRFDGFLHSESRDAAGHRNAELAQEFLALVFVDFHELGLSGEFLGNNLGAHKSVCAAGINPLRIWH